MQYFHELSEEERQAIFDKKIPVGEVVEKYKQPDWCEYPNALQGSFGCWSLIGGTVAKEGEEFCKTCDAHKNYKEETLCSNY